jgi:hypothetical protein
MKKPRAPGVERLLKARRAASKELRLATTDWRTRRYALLMCAHDNVTARLASGADFDVDNLLKIDAGMQEIRSSLPAEPLKVKVTFVPPTDSAPSDAAAVDGLVECRRCHWKPDGADRVSKCYRCGWVRGADTQAPWSPPFLPPPKPRALPAPAEAKPVHPNDLPRVDPGTVHSAPGARMQWLDYSGIAPTNGGYDPFQPAPNWSAGHPLPDIPPEAFGK